MPSPAKYANGDVVSVMGHTEKGKIVGQTAMGDSVFWMVDFGKIQWEGYPYQVVIVPDGFVKAAT